MARYVIFGAGAIGGTVGALLFEAGHEVLLIARGADFARIADRGLAFESPDGPRVLKIPVVDHVADAGLSGDDIVLLTTKTQDTDAAVVDLAAVADTEIPIVCFQNGVVNEQIVLRRFACVYGGFVYCPALHTAPGIVRVYGTPDIGIFDLGRYPHGSGKDAEPIAADLRGAGLLSNVHNEIVPWKYGKLLNNLHNALDVVFPQRNAAQAIADRVAEEGRRCLAAAGIAWADVDDLGERRHPSSSPAMLADQPYLNSSWQSVARATGAIETDYLNGEIVSLGRLHRVATPANTLIQRLCREIITGGRRAGSISPAQFMELLEGTA